MQQRFLYGVIALMAAVIVYLLFMPQKPVSAPSEVPPEATIPAEEVTEVPEPTNEPQAAVEAETVTIEGLFLGLAEEPTEFQKSFYYLLLDDGTEVVRIDLRPLLGYELLNPIEKLGVDRGQQVVITGTMGESGFTIAAIAPAP